MIRRLLASLVCAVLAHAAIAGTAPQDALKDLPQVSFPAAHRVASGRLQASDVALLKDAGIRQVIDLSADSETPDFDEAAAMRKAGIDYHNLPIHGARDLTLDSLAQFDQLLRHAGTQETLVHCASSNRVGAMIALRAAMIQGQPIDAALQEGRRWGLKNMEPAVRERLQAWLGSAAQAR